MVRENGQINRQLRMGQPTKAHVAALRSSMLFEQEFVEKWQKQQEMVQAQELDLQTGENYPEEPAKEEVVK